MSSTHAFRVSIVTPEGQVFDDDVTSLIVPGTVGYLGLQTDHAPIMTSLTSGKLSMTVVRQQEDGPARSQEKPDTAPVKAEETSWRINLLTGVGFLENSWDADQSGNHCRIVTRTVEFAGLPDYEQAKAYREAVENRLRQTGAAGKQTDCDRNALERIDRLIKAAGRKILAESNPAGH
jgi:F0F1-type ATP synthase epsilon subunit